MGRSGWLALATIGALAAWGTVVRGFRTTPFDPLFDKYGAQYQIDSNLLRAIGRQESNFKANAVRKETNGTFSIGVMQVLNKTAESLGVDVARLYDPAVNIETACRLLVALKRELGKLYTLDSWIAAYNAGSPAIIRRGIFNIDYVAAVMLYYRFYSYSREANDAAVS